MRLALFAWSARAAHLYFRVKASARALLTWTIRPSIIVRRRTSWNPHSSWIAPVAGDRTPPCPATTAAARPATTCPATCLANTDCASGYICDVNHHCSGTVGIGSAHRPSAYRQAAALVLDQEDIAAIAAVLDRRPAVTGDVGDVERMGLLDAIAASYTARAG